MADTREFQRRVQEIGGLVHEIESIADPAVRASTTKLLQLLMEFHGTALDRALEILARTGDPGIHMIDELGRDPLVSSLLVLYGLHPHDLPARAAKAIERIQPKLRKDGAEVELLGAENGVVRVSVKLGGHTCGSTAGTLRTVVEDAIYEAVPDLASLSITGLDGQPASGFVALDKLMAKRDHDSEERRLSSHDPERNRVELPAAG